MATGDLTDLASVKAWLAGQSGSGGNALGTASDDLFGSLISAASAFVAQYCQRSILTASYTETREGNGQTFMMMRQGPITAVASVAWNGQSVITAADPISLSQGYMFDDRRLSLIGLRFPSRLPVVIVYTAGFSACPLDLQQAVNELVGEAYKRRDHIGQSNKDLGNGQTVGFSQADMNATIKGVLDRYRFSGAGLMFNVTLVGADELIARLDQMPSTVQAVLALKVSALAIKLQTHITRDKLSGQVLNKRSGRLKNSIQEVVTQTPTSVVGKVFSSGDVKYAAIHEYGGTIPAHDIYPSKAEALHFLMGGKDVFAKVVHMPDVHLPERSFMRSSLADMAAEITREMKASVIQGMQQSVAGHP